MQGPWRERGFDPTVWRTPVARVNSSQEAGASGGEANRLTSIVLTYIASVVTSLAIMLVMLKAGW
jgi:ABC-type polysaccharide transport system permease subunit